jgi:hypothetical protein
LESVNILPQGGHRPPVSAIIPARNEEQSIAACVESLLAQMADLEVIVADDSSTDGTAAVVGAISQRDPRLRIIRVPPLPPGWTGKNHAVAQGAAAAGGEWLLLTDADTIHAPGGLEPVLASAERDGIDMLSLSPEQLAVAWWEKAVIPRIYRELEKLYSFDRINDPAQPDAAANGQYILVRRSVYEALGGHAAWRGEILEDVALAAAAKRAGYCLRFASGTGTVRTRMYRSFGAMWQGWSKNLYLLYGRRPGRVLAAVGAVVILDLLPLAFVTTWPAPALLWLAARHIWFGVRLRRAAARVRLAAYYLPGSLLFAAIALNSLLRHSAGLPLAWKGREYQPAPRITP